MIMIYISSKKFLSLNSNPETFCKPNMSTFIRLSVQGHNPFHIGSRREGKCVSTVHFLEDRPFTTFKALRQGGHSSLLVHEYMAPVDDQGTCGLVGLASSSPSRSKSGSVSSPI